MADLAIAIGQIFAEIPAWTGALLQLVGAASAVAALTPTPRDDRWAGQLYKIIEMLALNIGFAKDLPPNHRPLL